MKTFRYNRIFKQFLIYCQAFISKLTNRELCITPWATESNSVHLWKKNTCEEVNNLLAWRKKGKSMIDKLNVIILDCVNRGFSKANDVHSSCGPLWHFAELQLLADLTSSQTLEFFCVFVMDNGPIYVREKGSLRRVRDIVLAQPKPASSCRRTDPFVLKKEHFIFTYNEEGNLRYTTKSLFDVTLLFVVDNIHHVDSLVGFPEQIGDRLFVAAEENRVFLNPDISAKALKLFSDAYGEMVLGSLCLRNRFPLLHERMDEIKTFHSLKSLDLFGCKLGDDHEIFQHLTCASLGKSLIQLSIGGNSLSDVGLQRLTAPIRMKKKGLDCLQLLDVSCNPISERALRYLMCLPKLVKLNASGTSMKLGAGLKTSIWNMLGMIQSEKPLDTFDHSGCKTEGWAEQVVNQWETNGTQTPKLKKIEESRISALRFFGRQKFIRDVLNGTPLISESTEGAGRQRLHFHRPAAVSHVKEKPIPATLNHQVKSPCCRVQKRKQESEKCDASHQSPPTKRSSSSALTAEDMDLLNSY